MMPRSFLIAIFLSLLGYLVVSCESTILIVDNDDRGVFNSWEASLQTKAKHSIDYKHYLIDENDLLAYAHFYKVLDDNPFGELLEWAPYYHEEQIVGYNL